MQTTLYVIGGLKESGEPAETIERLVDAHLKIGLASDHWQVLKLPPVHLSNPIAVPIADSQEILIIGSCAGNYQDRGLEAKRLDTKEGCVRLDLMDLQDQKRRDRTTFEFLYPQFKLSFDCSRIYAVMT